MTCHCAYFMHYNRHYAAMLKEWTMLKMGDERFVKQNVKKKDVTAKAENFFPSTRTICRSILSHLNDN